jgi:hypothetical protein
VQPDRLILVQNFFEELRRVVPDYGRPCAKYSFRATALFNSVSREPKTNVTEPDRRRSRMGCND